MKSYVCHKDGVIFSVTTVDDVTAKYMADIGVEMIEWSGSPEGMFVDDGEVVPRLENPATLSGTTLSNLPNPCVLRIGGKEYECTDGVAELSFDYPGQHSAIVVAWPYLDKEFTIENPSQ